jgi:prevent-host-death family protein
MPQSASSHWQVQEAKQRFSEVLRAAESEGTQFVTRHGDEVVAVVPIQEYRRRRGTTDDFVQHLLNAPRLTEEAATVFDEIEAERAQGRSREIDLGLDS